LATEWYLLKTPYDQVSGFESEAFDDFGQEGFLEVLDSSIATTVKLCNYDLSDCREIRAVIQNNVQDTKLKTFVRHMIAPIGTCKAGMYVFYKNRYWLIVGIVDDNGVYEKAILSICNYQLSWINDSGKVVSRWANVASASQYNNGETATHNYFVRSDQLLVNMPDDDESQMLSQGKRFIVDRRCKVYEKKLGDVVDMDTSMPVITYQVTRVDSVLYNYIDSGLFEMMLTQDEQHQGDGYYVIDGAGYWLCEPELQQQSDGTLHGTADIEYAEAAIYNDMDPEIFTAVFYDERGEKVDAVPVWDIQCDFSDQLLIEKIDDSIMISVDDEKLINKSFDLVLSADGFTPASVNIKIEAFI